MKKLLVFLALFCFMTPAFADHKVVVQCLNSFSSDNPSAYFKAKAIEDIEFDNGIIFEKNTVISGKVKEVVDPKRAKRDAYFIITPLSYTTPSENMTRKINQTGWEAKVVGYKPFDAKETAKSGAVSVANFFVQGFSTAYYFTKGLIHPNEEDGRLKSGAKSAYDNSVLSYIQEGNALKVQQGDLLELVFYHSDVPKWKFWQRNK